MRFWLALSAAAVLAGCATEERSSKTTQSALRFIVIGDTPYGPEDEALLAAATPKINALNPDFVIHLGDFKGGRAPCDGEADDAFAHLVESLEPAPVFYTPGDNEWTDCDRNNDPSTGAPMSELGRLDTLRARYFSGPPAGAQRFDWRNQDGAPENATWADKKIRFVTLHFVGTANGWGFVQGDSPDLAGDAARTREALALEWLKEAVASAQSEGAAALVVAMQADPTETRNFVGVRCEMAVEDAYKCDAFLQIRAALRNAAVDFGKPVLVIHGDTEPFTLNQDFLDGGAPNLWRLNAAGDAGVGSMGLPYGVRDVTMVSFTPDAPAPFAARGLITNKTPDSK